MRKFSFLIISLLASATSAFAQIDNSGLQQNGNLFQVKAKHYNYELSVGPRAGIGLSSMSEGEGLSVADGGGLAYDGGLAVNARFGAKDSRGRYLDGQGLFGVGIELNYKGYGIKTKKDTKFNNDNLSFSYFEIPVLFQFYPMYNSKQLKNLYVELGPTFSIPLSTKPDNLKYSNSIDETTGSTHHTLYEETTYPTKDLKGMDVKLTFGIGYRFSKMSANDGLYVNARYNLGTSKLAGDFPAKLSSLELTVGYMFKCIGTK